MPSEKSAPNPGYLQKILVNGTKPFRYRSGIRTLLGLPENPDRQMSYPLPLPLAGFHYLRNAFFDEVGKEASPSFGESRFLESQDAGISNMPAFQKIKASAPEVDHSEVPSNRLGSKVLSLLDTQKVPVKLSEARPTPIPSDRTWAGNPTAQTGNAEELKIDIPGFSEKQILFPGIASQKIKEPPKAASSVQVSGLPGKKEEDPSSADIETSNDFSFNKTAANEEPVPLLRMTPRAPAVSDRLDPKTVHPILGSMSEKKKDLLAEDIAGNESLSRSNRPMITPKPAGQSQALPIQARQHAAEAQIEQLRQSLRRLNRKTASEDSNAQSSQNEPHPEPKETHPAPHLIQQPVVIVNRSPVQRRTPSAFWERRYMSRLFRVRPLR